MPLLRIKIFQIHITIMKKIKNNLQFTLKDFKGKLMKTLIKSTIANVATKTLNTVRPVAHRLFEAVPPSTESMEAYQTSPSDFEQEKLEKFLDAQSAFGKYSLITMLLTRDRKKAQVVALTGFMVGLTHVYDFHNVKYHANKNK